MLAWRSADPELVVQEVGSTIAGKCIVDVSAGKYRTAVVTSDGDIYMWEGWSKPLEAGAASSRSSSSKEAPVPPTAVLGKSPDAPRCATSQCGLYCGSLMQGSNLLAAAGLAASALCSVSIFRCRLPTKFALLGN